MRKYDQIQDAFVERSKDIRQKARKFAKLAMNRYQSHNILYTFFKESCKVQEEV